MKKIIKYIFLYLFLVNLSKNGLTQDLCGTTLSEEQMNEIHLTKQLRENAIKNLEKGFQPKYGLMELPVQIHIVLKKDKFNVCGLKQSEMLTGIELANQFFEQAGIKVTMCGPPNYIYNNDYYEWTSDEIVGLCDANDVQGVLNVYAVKNIDGNNGIAGLYPKGGKNRILVKIGVFSNTSTLAHEIGHYLGLPHTHGNNSSNCLLTTELVNGSNCTIAGDRFCDTPADPYLGSGCGETRVDADCNYIGTVKDKNGDSFNPLTNNLMSYAPDKCTNSFTIEQKLHMRYVLDHKSLICCNNNASDYIEISEKIIDIATYQATNSIKAYNEIEAFAKADYVAGKKVTLNTGLHAKPGCHLKVFIADCKKFPEIKDPVNCSPDITDFIPLPPETNNNKLLNTKINSKTKEKEYITAFPNPFDTEILFNYEITEQNYISLTIYNTEGKKIAILLNNHFIKPGKYQLKWNTSNIRSGMYFYTLQIGDKVTKGKIIKLK